MWSVWTAEGKVVMAGAETSRAAAGYRANSALFLLLQSSPYRRLQSPAHAEQPRARVRR
jgi:hypothetical protein